MNDDGGLDQDISSGDEESIGLRMCFEGKVDSSS